jgi:hypothetical protein
MQSLVTSIISDKSVRNLDIFYCHLDVVYDRDTRQQSGVFYLAMEVYIQARRERNNRCEDKVELQTQASEGRHSHKCHTMMSWAISDTNCTRHFNEDVSSRFSNSAQDVLTSHTAAELKKDGYETSVSLVCW